MTQRIVDQRMDGTVVDGGSFTTSTATAREEPKLPEKFSGKSVEEIVAAYENLEKELGRKGNELGELRKMADKLIERGLGDSPPQKPVEEETIDKDDFFEDPVTAVTRIVEKAVKPVESKLSENRRESALSALRQKHPDLMQTIENPDFQDWIMSSSSRQVLWGQASQGNFDVADELFTEYEKMSGADREKATAAKETANAQKEQELAAATTVGRGASGDATEGYDRKKVFKRAELIRLQLEDPMAYQQMQPEIMQAYVEKRVI